MPCGSYPVSSGLIAAEELISSPWAGGGWDFYQYPHHLWGCPDSTLLGSPSSWASFSAWREGTCCLTTLWSAWPSSPGLPGAGIQMFHGWKKGSSGPFSVCITLTGCYQALLSLLGEISHRVVLRRPVFWLKDKGWVISANSEKIHSLGVMSAFQTPQTIQAKASVILYEEAVCQWALNEVHILGRCWLGQGELDIWAAFRG